MGEKELREMAALALRYAAEITDTDVDARFKLMAADLMAQADVEAAAQRQQQAQPDKKED